MSHQCNNRGREISIVHFNWEYVNKKPAYIWISIKRMSAPQIWNVSHYLLLFQEPIGRRFRILTSLLDLFIEIIKALHHFCGLFEALCFKSAHLDELQPLWMTDRRRILKDLLADAIFRMVIMEAIYSMRIHSLGLSSLHSSNASLHIRNRTWKSFLNPPWGSTIWCKGIVSNIFLAKGTSKSSRLRLTNFLCKNQKMIIQKVNDNSLLYLDSVCVRTGFKNLGVQCDKTPLPCHRIFGLKSRVDVLPDELSGD